MAFLARAGAVQHPRILRAKRPTFWSRIKGDLAYMFDTVLLNSFVGKHISAICPNGYDSDSIFHCAHFVGHALDITVGKGCLHLVHGPGETASIRVDEIYNSACKEVGAWATKKSSVNECLIFITNPKNFTGGRMGQGSTKHVGIFVSGSVWHYSNTNRKVVKVPVANMQKHYPRASDNGLYYGILK